MTLPRLTTRLAIEVIGAAACLILGMGLGAYRVLIEENATAKRVEASTERSLLYLGAALFECRAGREWESLEDWSAANPGCDFSCLLKRLEWQAAGVETSVATLSSAAPQDGLQGPSTTAPCTKRSGQGVEYQQRPIRSHSGHRDSVRRGVALDATPRERGGSSIETLGECAKMGHIEPASTFGPGHANKGHLVWQGGSNLLDFANPAFAAGPRPGYHFHEVAGLDFHSLLLFPRGLHGAHPQVSTSSLRGLPTPPTVTPLPTGATGLLHGMPLGRLGGLLGSDLEVVSAPSLSGGVELHHGAIEGIAAVVPGHSPAQHHKLRAVPHRIGAHHHQAPVVVLNLASHHGSNIGTAVPISKGILSGVFPE
jgi:hypothetical protein